MSKKNGSDKATIMLKQPLNPPQFSTEALIEATQPTPDSSAGLAEITRLEAFLLACWRNGDVDMLRTLTNSLTGVGGLKLVWSDPLFDEDDSDE